MLKLTGILTAMMMIGTAAMGQTAQNSDISILGGTSTGSTETYLGTRGIVTGTIGAAVSVSAGHELKAGQRAQLWFEIPNTWLVRTMAGLGYSITATTGTTYYFTPGLRLVVPMTDRLSFYGSAGGGFAKADTVRVIVGGEPFTNVNPDGIKGAFSAAGGVDFRLIRRLSLRMEVRDFVSAKGMGGNSGRNQALVLGGLAFHF